MGCVSEAAWSAESIPPEVGGQAALPNDPAECSFRTVSKWFRYSVTCFSRKSLLFHDWIAGQDDHETQQKRSVPRARIELATHGSSGHVLSDSRNRVRTQVRRHMVTSESKWFNEKDGEQASAHVRQWPSRAKELNGVGHVRITERHRSGKIRTVLLNTIVQVNDSVVA